MPMPLPKVRWTIWLQWALQLMAGVAGLKFGFDFGFRVDGPWLGVVMALNSALFCSIMAGAVVGRLLPQRNARRDEG